MERGKGEREEKVRPRLFCMSYRQMAAAGGHSVCVHGTGLC